MIKKMLRKDILLLSAFLIIALLMVGYGAFQAIKYAPSGWKIVILISCSACLLVLSVCFIEIAKHLRNNAAEVYVEELTPNNEDVKNKIFIIADILFVLVLCFAILLTTMLITKRVGGWDYVQNGYRINPILVIGVFGSIGGYLTYLIKMSLKCYDEVENEYYSTKAKGEK